MRKAFLILILFQATVFTYAQQSGATSKSPEILDAKTFQAKLAKRPGAILLDVRTAVEVEAGVIPGAIVIDYNAPNFSTKIETLDKSKPYFVYCKGGSRSKRAVEQMSKAGFKELYALKDGFDDWINLGLPRAAPND